MEPEAGTASATTIEGAAPAVAAPSPAEPATVAAPDKRSRKDAIIKSVRAAQSASETGGEAPKPTPVAAPVAVATPVVALPVATPDPRLTALETEAADLRKQLEERSKVKEAPKDLEGFVDFMEDEGFSIEKISELWLKRQDNPAHKELTAAEKRLKAIEDKIAAGEKADKDRADRAALEQSEAEGRKQLRTMLDGDKARWPRLTRSEDNIGEAMSDVTAKAREKWATHVKAGKAQNEAEATRVLGEALDDLEKDRASRWERYALPDITARPTIRSTTGTTGTLPTPRPEPAEPLTREQKKQALLARVRAGQPQKN